MKRRIRDYVSAAGGALVDTLKNPHLDLPCLADDLHPETLSRIKKEKMSEKLGTVSYIAAASTIIGAGPYLTGKWPFTSFKAEKKYYTTLWINEHIGPVLKGPETRWLIKPLYDVLRDENGRLISISGEINQRDERMINFRTRDGLEGEFAVQYHWWVPTREDAKRFYWNFNGDVTRIDEMAYGALQNMIGSIPGKMVAQPREMNAERGAMETSWARMARRWANYRLETNRTGIVLTDYAITRVDFDEPSQEILSQEIRAIEGAKATKIQATVTEAVTGSYINAAIQYSKYGSTVPTGNIALILADMDNNQEISGVVVKTTGLPGAIASGLSGLTQALSRNPIPEAPQKTKEDSEEKLTSETLDYDP